MAAGQNTVSGELLRSFVERIEFVRDQKKDLAADEKAIFAEAKSSGYVPETIRAVLKRRKMKPNDAADAEAMFDMYMHALGMAVEPPLFRFSSLAKIDVHVREQVIERMGDFVPGHGDGHIEVNWGGKVWRLQRDKDGSVNTSEVVAAPPRTTEGPLVANVKPKAAIPDVDEAGARELGQQAARENKPVIENPFPFGDKRRAVFDEGWRSQSGGDGMGPDEGDEK